MDKCPHCGSKEYYRTFTMRGKGVYHYRFDRKHNDSLERAEQTDNSGMHDGFDYVETKTLYCSECNRKLGTTRSLNMERTKAKKGGE